MTDATTTPYITEVVLSGGGTNAFTIVGSLYTLYQKKVLDRVVRWVGSSAGALESLFMVIGYSPVALYRMLLNIDYEKLNDANCDSVLSFYDTMGVLDGKRIMRILELAIIKKGFHKDITFCELVARTKKELVITGYNLTRGKTEAFDARRTPHMSVLLACRISMSVPFLFQPVLLNGHMYIDGCTMEHVPVRFSTHKDKCLIIQCLRDNTARLAPPPPQDVPSFFALLNRRVGEVLHKKCMHKVTKHQPQSILSIYIPQTQHSSFIVDFGITLERKQQLFLLGTDATQRYINSLLNNMND